MNLAQVTPKLVEAEASRWIRYLNEIIGVLCFNLGLGAAGTPHPSFYGALSLVFVMIFHFGNSRKKAAMLVYLSEKKDKDPLDIAILKDLQSQIKFSKLGLATFGYLFLIYIIMSPFIIDSIKKLFP